MADSQCELCLEYLDDGQLNRHSGIDLCDRCLEGDVMSRVRPRGFHFDVETWKTTSTDSNNRKKTWYNVRVTGSLPDDPPVDAAFCSEGLLEKIAKLFRKEIQVGDPLFDDYVYVRTDTPEATERLLESEGAQMAIMEFVTSDGLVSIDSGRVSARRSDVDKMPDTDSMYLNTALLLHFLSKL